LTFRMKDGFTASWGFSACAFIALFEDRAGALWIGTQGGGLNRFDPSTETFTRYLHTPVRHVFRLKQIDFDGTFEIHPEVEVLVFEQPGTLNSER